MGRWLRRGIPALVMALAAPRAGDAQQGGALAVDAASAGSETEAYLRALQVAGRAPAYPWSARAFSQREAARLLPDSAHPWAARQGADGARRAGIRLLGPGVRMVYNSAFPHGFNDGPAWSGRGMNAELRAGIAAHVGPLSLRIEPVAFWAENRAFALLDNGETGDLAFAHGLDPRSIDLPQRFGPRAYTRVDPGESTVRLDVGGVAAGVSTAAEQWGPAVDHPLVLGTNAGGVPRVFLGTAAPVNVGVGRLHGRMMWGSLAQSGYSWTTGPGSRRFATGAVAVFTPRGADHLELGVSRFFHLPWPEGGVGIDEFLKLLDPLEKADADSTGTGPDGRTDVANQLASAFVRWVLPAAGVEAYAEFARDDHSWDVLDLTLEPDHASGYTLGLRKVWSRGTRLVSLRGEVMSTQPGHLAEVRGEFPFYVHARTPQGHTLRGQVLGSAYGYGGGAGTLALDVYGPRGRWGLAWTRGRVADRADYWRTGVPDARSTEVVHSLGLDGALFAGGVQLTAALTATADLNRNFAEDAYNLGLRLGVRAGP
ncbi:MAG TPA: capsule assembly Wzi family protein [Longimicrobium sp.]|nr:capsule assembly Wzi family protein [Longimicrobium sp.]